MKVKLLKVQVLMTLQIDDQEPYTTAVFQSRGDVTVTQQEFATDYRKEGLGLMAVGKSLKLEVKDSHEPIHPAEAWSPFEDSE